RPSGNTEILSSFQIENTRLVLFLESPAQTENGMIQWQCVNVELILIEDASTITSRKFLHVELERELQFGSAKCSLQENPEAFGSKNVQRCLAAVEMKRTQQASDAVEMIAVKVSNEDRMDPTSFHARPHQLQLRAFTAVEQEHVTFTDQGRGGEPSR